MTETAIELFETWSIYDRILERNLMYHDEIFADVRSILAARFGDRPVSILDLGCGGARHIPSAVEGLRVARYVGHDLSAAALECARANLARVDAPVELRRGDLLEGLADGRDRFDVILSSFAVHHLSLEEKALFFRRAADRLAPGGLVLMVDMVREEGEGRPAFLDGYCGWIRFDWSSLPGEALDAIIDHVRANDFPETPATLRALALDAGLGWCWEERRLGWHRIFRFERDLRADWLSFAIA